MALPTQVKLALLAILGGWAILTFASTDLQAQRTATNPAPTASIPALAWTAAQQKKIALLMSTYGKVGPLNHEVTAAFGLSKGNEVLSARQLAYSEPPSLHAYFSLPDGRNAAAELRYWAVFLPIDIDFQMSQLVVPPRRGLPNA